MSHPFKKQALTLALALAGVLSSGFAHAAGSASFVFVSSVPGLRPTVILGVGPNPFDFGSVAVGQSASQTFTVTNTGGGTATGIQYATSAGFTATGSCGATLASGASCQEQVSFSPAAGQSYSGTFSASSEGVTGSASLVGLGLATSDSLSSGTLTFGAQTVGTTSAPKGVTLTNTGNTSLAISQISTSGNYAATQNCGSSLGVGASCIINVTFTPQTQGNNSGALSVVTGAGTQTVSLTGTGQQAVLAASPTSLSFGSVVDGQSSAVQTFTLANSGNVAATSLGLVAPTGYTATSTCGTSLAAGANCSVSVTFSPTTAGSISGNVVVSSSAATVNVGVTGTGAAACSASPSTIVQNSDFSIAVPTGCGHMKVDMWGAGGAGPSGAGGGGGYVGSTVAVSSGSTILVRVGQGGQINGSSYAGGYGGGGSFLYINSSLQLAAGGGGGGGGTGQNSAGSSAGAGGGSTGVAGVNQILNGTYEEWGGNPGTQSGGGANTAGNTNINAGGNAGGYLTGGGYLTTGTNYGGGGAATAGSAGNGAGGGGGGGYYGGSAGAGGGYYVGGAGGGGGSGYVAAGLSGTLTAGTGATPGNSGSSLRGSYAVGGSGGGAGAGGIAVLTWSQ